MRRKTCLRHFLGFVVIGLLSSTSNAAAEALRSGRTVGEKVPSFYVRAVTGPLQNRSTCYVCRNGSRPVAMILLRQIEPELKPLLQGVDRIVDAHRADGLRSFCVLVSDTPRQAISDVQTFAFNHQVVVPMTIASQAIAGPANQNLHPDAAITVVLYEQQKVVKTFAFRSGELAKDQTQAVWDAIRKLVSTAH
ncbi:hypothetical protein [Thalassoroseus pseudoceratinae]|uniref:hypothetical protein n=1 Tax=Thalassoroseus pseudoceratinae TaxID=2713176 RepID=UPI00141E0411|nr:hypothetical protein [Thalassoroseus pseudoceratinae]